MKKILTVSMILLLAGFVVFAGGVSAKSNLSTGWLRNPSRNTETKRPDASIYNIAGTAFADDGLYFEVGNQFVFKGYSHKVNNIKTPIPTVDAKLKGNKYEENEPIWLFPDFVSVYKRDKWAASFNFTIVAGGGTVNYENGTALTDALIAVKGTSPGTLKKHSVEAKSVVYGETLTFAYKPIDWLSVSVGARLLENTQSMNIECKALSLDGGYKANGVGFGGIFGVHAKPIEGLDLSLQYKTKVGIEMKLKEVDSKLTDMAGVKNDDKFDSDIPAEIQVGAGYRFMEPLYASASFGYYFAEDAHQYSALGKDKWENSWNLQLGLDWDVNDKLCLSTGYNHGKEASADDKNTIFSPVLEVNAFFLGAEYKFNNNLTGAFGAMYSFNKEKDYSTKIGGAMPVSYTLNSDTVICSIGLTYKAL